MPRHRLTEDNDNLISFQRIVMTDVWTAVLDDLAKKVSSHIFESWFKNISFDRVESDVAYLFVDDDFFKVWIENNYLDLIEHSFFSVLAEPIRPIIEVRDAKENVVSPVQSITLSDQLSAAKQGRAGSAKKHVAVEGVSTSDLNKKAKEIGLNPRYTFDEFVVGGNNEFVHAASAAVASSPTRTYNPLFIFGGTGLGKTHLLQAIGLEALKRDPTTRVCYLSTEEFTNQMISALRSREMPAFRQRFRDNVDLLLIDDIQFIGGKVSTQEEFFHTFNALYNSGKQIVITSDKSPRDLPGIEERLASRFAWGLIADIQPPRMETRVAILEKKAEADGIRLSKEVAMLIASTISSNVRELEGTLIRLGAQASLMGTLLTPEFVKKSLAQMNLQRVRVLTTKQIIKIVANYYDIKPADIRGPGRTRAISRPRQIAMYLSRKLTSSSFPELGRDFKKDQSSVISAFKKMSKIVDKGEDLSSDIAKIESTLMR